MKVSRSRLSELRVLLVEDESLIAMLIEDTLFDLDCQAVSVAPTVADALDKLASTEFDIAILDVNLNGSQSYPIAEVLVRKHIPFIFSTGYGASGVPEAFRAVPVLVKPFRAGDVARSLEAALKADKFAKKPGIAAPPTREPM